jgi:subfamily B ATP-binding cassette protein MsbA
MRRLIRLLWYVRPYWLQLFASLLLFAMVGLLEAFRIALLRPIFDHVFSVERAGPMMLFKIPRTHYIVYLDQFVPGTLHDPWQKVAFALVAATFLKGIFDYVGTYLVNYAGFGLVTDLRNDIYESVMRRSAAFFQRNPTGKLVSAIINDIDKVQFAMSSVLAEFLQQFFIFIFNVALVIAVGGKRAWILLIFVPVIIMSSRKIGRQVRSTTRKGQDKLAEIQNILHETITGNRIVKAFSMELWETMRFKAAAKRLFSANMRYVVAMAVSSPLMDLLGMVAVALLLKLGSDSISHGTMKIGDFMTFITATFLLYQPVRKFSTFYNSFQQALGSSESVFSFMDAKDEVREKTLARKLGRFHDSIRFEDVRFCYNDGEDAREVLSGVNLEVKAGELLAIVGGSGAGKSTLVHLIPRFFDVTGGRILMDGNDIREVSLASLRGQIGIVAQETMLFNDTVRNNIAYGQPHVSQEEVERAAKAALAHDFILRMPEGYETVIGERGFRLSGGERQRLSIARALLKNAPVLILDEATSALDSESEALVQAALQNLMADRTVFVIAHRLSTVRRADRIIVLENGQITDSGTHEELMSRLGTYRRLHDLQFVDADTPRVAVQESSGEPL